MWNRLETLLLGGPAQSLPTAVCNEIYKLRAGAADRLSTACFSVGAVGLLSPLFVGILQPTTALSAACRPEWNDKPDVQAFLEANRIDCRQVLDWLGTVQIGFGVIFWIGLGFMLHMIGEVFLTRMEAK